jgi:hypothetical protein
LDAVAIAPPRCELWLLEAVAGEALVALDECLQSGMLRIEDQAVAFRHELARLAVEDSISPHHRIALHRSALSALRSAPGGTVAPARLAHHAEAAADGAAVLELAPAAAEQAAAVGAHREAAAQYARALRFADGLADGVRGTLLDRRAYECYLIGEFDAAVAAGGNQVYGPGLLSSDQEAAYRRALQAAVADARVKAQTLAGASGVSLGTIRTIVESGATSAPLPMAAAASDAAATPIEQGTQTVEANVSVTFAAG